MVVPPRSPRPTNVLLADAAAARGDHEAYVTPASGPRPRSAVDFDGLARRVRGLATTFVHAGVRRGDVVALELPPSVELLVAALGAQWLGAVVASLDPTWPRPMRAHLLRRSGPRVVVRDDGIDPVSVSVPTFAASELDAAMDAPPAPEVPVALEDPATILWTTATSGVIEGVVSTHAALAEATDPAPLEPGRWWSALPQRRADLLAKVSLALKVQATVVESDPDWHPDHAAQLLSGERVSVATATSAQWEALAASWGSSGTRLRGLRGVVVDPERLSPAVVEQLGACLGRGLWSSFRPVETNAGISGALRSAGASTVVSGGRPEDGVVLELRDPDGRGATAGSYGMLAMRSPAQMLGYLGHVEVGAGSSRLVLDLAATDAAVDRRGWFCTGRLARRGPTGLIEVAGASGVVG